MIFAKRTATPKRVALTLSILGLLAGSVYSAAIPNEFGYVLNGCSWRYKDPDVQTGCGSLSLMGGAQVFVHGNGFDEMPQNNLIDFLNTQFEGEKIHLGNFLSGKSNPS